MLLMRCLFVLNAGIRQSGVLSSRVCGYATFLVLTASLVAFHVCCLCSPGNRKPLVQRKRPRTKLEARSCKLQAGEDRGRFRFLFWPNDSHADLVCCVIVGGRSGIRSYVRVLRVQYRLSQLFSIPIAICDLTWPLKGTALRCFAFTFRTLTAPNFCIVYTVRVSSRFAIGAID